MQTDKTYNGWTNYETWLFNLWHDDCFTEEAQECYNDAEADDTFSKEENATIKLADSIEAYAEEFTFMDAPEKGFLADLVTAAMQQINFYEIAEHYINDIKE
jgi:hypothetical protein